MFNTSIKNNADNKRVLAINISGVIVSSGYWDDETGSDQVTKIINSFSATENDEITVSINSVGGDYFAGVSIYNTLKNSPAKVITKNMGIAASAACVIFMAGDERIVYSGTSTMTHDPLVEAYGNADSLRDVANTLDDICASAKGVFLSAGIDETKLVELMKGETMMTPQVAVEHGFATSYNELLSVQNCAITDDMKSQAVSNSFGIREKEPKNKGKVFASADTVISLCCESGLDDMIAIFNKKGFTERELNDTIACTKDIKNACAASGLNFESIKNKVFDTGELIRAVINEKLSGEDQEIESGGSSYESEFTIKPINGC